MNPPVVVEHQGIRVVRDDMIAGGTKARFLPVLFGTADEVVYATPAEGGAQAALGYVAKTLGKRATVFVARRADRHPRTREACRAGAQIIEVAPGYLSVVQARAREYCRRTGAMLAPFGMDLPEAVGVIASAARATSEEPDEVWCARGSGVLARSLAEAWPKARRHVVQVGRDLEPGDVNGAKIHIYPLPFSRPATRLPPFPSDPHYDAKAWQMCLARHGDGNVLFWNVARPAVEIG